MLQREDIDEDYSIIFNTLQKDPTSSEMEAVTYIYTQLRGTDPPDEDTARGIIEKMFFSDRRYTVGEVGRYKVNRKLNLQSPLDTLELSGEHMLGCVPCLRR